MMGMSSRRVDAPGSQTVKPRPGCMERGGGFGGWGLVGVGLTEGGRGTHTHAHTYTPGDSIRAGILKKKSTKHCLLPSFFFFFFFF